MASEHTHVAPRQVFVKPVYDERIYNGLICDPRVGFDKKRYVGNSIDFSDQSSRVILERLKNLYQKFFDRSLMYQMAIIDSKSGCDELAQELRKRFGVWIFGKSNSQLALFRTNGIVALRVLEDLTKNSESYVRVG